MEIKNEKKRRKIESIFALSCCSYWMLNSGLGLYMLLTYPGLSQSHPNLYAYISIFSAKWLIAFVAAFTLILIVSLAVKVIYKGQDIYSQSLGAFPIMYLLVIFVSYMGSLYHGAFII